MGRIPITVMGYRCERCSHEWIPKSLKSFDSAPSVCPKCKSAWWDRPRKAGMNYENFRDKVEQALKKAEKELTWTEIRTVTGLPQLFPNNQWVHRLEKDIGLKRQRDAHGIIHWRLSK